LGFSNPNCGLSFAPIVFELERKETPAKDFLHRQFKLSSSNPVRDIDDQIFVWVKL